MIEPKIMTRLKENVASVSDRVHWPSAPQGTLTPYVTVNEVSDAREYSHQGYSDLRRTRWQINVYAQTYVQAKQTAAEVITAMENWRGDGIHFTPLQNKLDLYEDATSLYHIPLDFFIYYKE